ncbi:MAG: 2-C-methyl-D-erythritol 2,4-cyclodiphosphate synthase [Christensenellaceae bacterium]|jgi:2-C-methyl-D-erythritol 4-phosphate cytidylyltransferase/2-C-methyl-D-erythritol 2,4-cyclodiphosphate synthase|nr:2-C-methyl-D-erythritol 2,4-cyclodiphosphate synthase [Christensenellaceae bacterium]
MNNKFDVILPAAGKSSRMAGIDKLLFEIGGISVLLRTVETFINVTDINKIIIATQNITECRDILSSIPQEKLIIVSGGASRCASVECALNATNSEYVLIHDAARPFVSKQLIARVMESTIKFGSGIPAVMISDSVRVAKSNTLVSICDRSQFYTVQTPQGFITSKIKRAFEMRTNDDYTDESALYLSFIEEPRMVDGDESNIKLTNKGDLFGLNAKIGLGYDSHRLIYNRKLVLGGIEIASEKGSFAHSDGDAVIHALIDALLSAAGERDIGTHFPNTSHQFKDADSSILLSEVMQILSSRQLSVSNVSIIIILDAPKLGDIIPIMRIKLSNILKTPATNIAIAAKTTEGISPDVVEALAAVNLSF